MADQKYEPVQGQEKKKKQWQIKLQKARYEFYNTCVVGQKCSVTDSNKGDYIIPFKARNDLRKEQIDFNWQIWYKIIKDNRVIGTYKSSFENILISNPTHFLTPGAIRAWQDVWDTWCTFLGTQNDDSEHKATEGRIGFRTSHHKRYLSDPDKYRYVPELLHPPDYKQDITSLMKKRRKGLPGYTLEDSTANYELYLIKLVDKRFLIEKTFYTRYYDSDFGSFMMKYWDGVKHIWDPIDEADL